MPTESQSTSWIRPQDKQLRHKQDNHWQLTSHCTIRPVTKVCYIQLTHFGPKCALSQFPASPVVFCLNSLVLLVFQMLRSVKKNGGVHSKMLQMHHHQLSLCKTILSSKDSCIFSTRLFAFQAVNHLVTAGVCDGNLVLEWSLHIYIHKVSRNICIFTFQLSALLPDTNSKQSQCS